MKYYDKGFLFVLRFYVFVTVSNLSALSQIFCYQSLWNGFRRKKVLRFSFSFWVLPCVTASRFQL